MDNKIEPTAKKPESLAELLAKLKGADGIGDLKPQTKKEINQYIESRLAEAVDKEVGKAAKEIKSTLLEHAEEISNESFDSIKEKIEKDRLNTIQATSIVTVFIGFLVVQFNILQFKQSVEELAGLSLILLSSILIFVLLIDLVIKLDLPYKKTRSIKGSVANSFSALSELFGTRTEEIPLTWSPNSWGEGLKIRVIAIVVALTLMAVGVRLIS